MKLVLNTILLNNLTKNFYLNAYILSIYQNDFYDSIQTLIKSIIFKRKELSFKLLVYINLIIIFD